MTKSDVLKVFEDFRQQEEDLLRKFYALSGGREGKLDRYYNVGKIGSRDDDYWGWSDAVFYLKKSLDELNALISKIKGYNSEDFDRYIRRFCFHDKWVFVYGGMISKECLCDIDRYTFDADVKYIQECYDALHHYAQYGC